MPRPKKKQVTIVEPMKYDTVKMKLRGAERKSRARLREELEHDLAEVVEGCTGQSALSGPLIHTKPPIPLEIPLLWRV